MNLLLLLAVLTVFTLLFALLTMWLDRRLIRHTLTQQARKVESITRQWFSEYPVASQSRTYHVIYRTSTGEMHSRTCQVFGTILWRELIWLNPLADFRLIPKRQPRQK